MVERREFYRDELDVRGLSLWLRGRERRTKLAVIPGRHTGVCLPVDKHNCNDVILIDMWRSAHDVREWALRYLPESVYYDRNRYFDVTECARCGERKRGCEGCYNYDGQQLAFDLDPENVDCPVHGTIGDKIDSGRGMLSFCMLEFNSLRRQAQGLAEEMRKRYEGVRVIYSGRGFHVVTEDEEAYALTRKERKSLARSVARTFDIDEWVTEGSSRLMRLPFTLNALVSRRCMRIVEERDLVRFDPRVSSLVLPDFLKSS